ncbi:MAG: SDR family NAD(P)-dependent oxidoreductase [Candidatus Geothermarchaeales archaeon]
MRFSGKVALVTGGNRGIGRAISINLAREGAKVAINYRKNEEEAKETLEEIERLGGRAVLMRADLRDGEEVEKMIDRVIKRLGGLDILVNNAGFGILTPLVETTEELWDRTINVNLRGAFLTSKFAAPHMMEQRGGRIINVSSIAGVRGIKFLGAYSASKFGLIGLTQALALELAPYDITVNAVCPGLVRTKMGLSLVQWVAERSPRYEGLRLEEAVRKWAEENSLLGRMVEPVDVANVVAFLASDEAKNITGQAILVDAGVEARGGRAFTGDL